MTLPRRLLRQLPVATAIALALVLRAFVVESFAVDGSSMAPSFATGDRVIVEKLVGPSRGDVVVLHAEGMTLIKRVVALGGDVVKVRGCVAVVNGMPVDGPEIDRTHGPNDGLCRYGPRRVPPGSVFVLGDNRDDSMDSRVFGPVPLDDVVGHALVVVWPPSHARPLG